MIVDSQNIEPGTIIKFRTINAHDSNLYSGTVAGICEYAIAKDYKDVVAYNKEVKEDTPSIADATELNYFIINLQDGSKAAFAAEWVEASSLIIIDAAQNVTILLYNTTTSAALTAIQLLTDNGYPCKIVE